MTLTRIFSSYFARSSFAFPALLAFLGFFVSQAALADTVTDRIVAKVNRDIITLSELQTRLKTLSPAQKAALSASGSVEHQLLEMMVNEELISQAAAKMGIMVSEAEIDEAVGSIMTENKINQTQLRQSLAASGTTEEAFRNQLRMEILRNKIVGYNIMSKVVITDQEVIDFLNGKVPVGASQIVSATGVSDFDGVRMIFLRSSPQEAPRVMGRAAQIRSEIEGGLSFAEAAQKYSEGPGAENGGDPGNLIVRDLQPELQELARTLVPGTVSEPLNGGEVVLLITIVPLRPQATSTGDSSSASEGDSQSFTEEQKAAARRQLEQMKLRAKYETWITDLRNTAIIKITL